MSSLYYEIHITLEPCFENMTALKELGGLYGFRMADLLMKKKDGPGGASHNDMFFTSRAKTYEYAKTKTENFCKRLQGNGYTIRRYKIEDTLNDSKIFDSLNIMEKVA